MCDPLCMNIMEGGHGGYCGDEGQFRWSSSGGKASWEKSREKLIKAVKKGGTSSKARGTGLFSQNNPRNKGMKFSDDHKKRIGEANSISQKGEKNSQFGLRFRWINNGINNAKLKLDLEIPEGWKLGKLPIRKYQKD